jgi:hypothetical protein
MTGTPSTRELPICTCYYKFQLMSRIILQHLQYIEVTLNDLERAFELARSKPRHLASQPKVSFACPYRKGYSTRTPLKSAISNEERKREPGGPNKATRNITMLHSDWLVGEITIRRSAGAQWSGWLYTKACRGKIAEDSCGRCEGCRITHARALPKNV